MEMKTLWCYAGSHLGTKEGLCGVGGRRALGVGFAAREHISALGMTLKTGVETLWFYAGQNAAAPEGLCGVCERRALGIGFAA